jgi:glutamine synthetase
MTLVDDFKLRKTDNFDELNDVNFIQVRYTDLIGKFLAKYSYVDNDKMNAFFKNGIGVDGSSVRGFASINESDQLLIPDRSTLRLCPTFDYNVATVIADVYAGYGNGRLTRDPRLVTQQMEGYLANNKMVCQVGPEVECFIFDSLNFKNTTLHKEKLSGTKDFHDHAFEISSQEEFGTGKYPIRKKGGYDAPPFQDSLVELRFEIALLLEKYFRIKVTNLNHEVASSGQIEINFIHSSLTNAADNVQIYKDVVRNVAKSQNKVANFMPKPLYDDSTANSNIADNGSGMHISISLWKSSTESAQQTSSSSSSSSSSSFNDTNNDSSICDQNIFFDKDDPYAELSQAGRYFIGGLLDHALSLAAIVAPTVNSYHRLVPGFEAPVYAAWSRGNRSAVIRVPTNEKNNYKSKRIEFRAPDPSSNPYLAFSAIVAAGMDGINKKIDPGSPINENIYKLNESQRAQLGIRSLPSDLKDSLDALKSDSKYLATCFSNEVLETYMELKKVELEQVGNSSREIEFETYYDV